MSAYYSFLPHIRQGLAGEISIPDDLYGSSPATRDRVTLPVNLTVQETSVSGSAGNSVVTQQVSLKGPGDIIGINGSAIVKAYPKDWTTNFEPNYLPYIEFYDEDFPWRYTPAKAVLDAGNENRFRLRPWISLIVLKETEFTDEAFNGILSSIAVNVNGGGAFPSEKQTWAWAHVHVNDDLGTYATGTGSTNIDPNLVVSSVTSSSASNPNSLINKLKSNPDIAVSRILCPRRLEPNTSYHAFLIPTFEIGRKAGLGQTVNPTDDSLKPSWTGGAVQKSFPVYYRWFFKTGVSGDFESLVRLLKPKIVGNDVGKRAIDLQLPGNPLLETQAINNDTPDTIGLQGVLKPPGQVPDPWNEPNPFSAALKILLNNPAGAQSGSPDPILGPPIYGQWHVQISTLTGNPSADWIHKVNLDPRYRVFAGIGAEVVRKNQDKYMDIAWAQIGEVLEANRKLRQMQLAMQASQLMHNRHVKSLSDELVVNIAAPVHTKVKATAQTVYKDIADSVLPNAMFSGAFRRITNPGSPLARGMASNGASINTASLINDVNNGTAATAFAYTPPAGMSSLTILPPSSYTPGYASSIPPSSSFLLTPPGSSYPPASYNPANPPSPSAQAFLGAVVPTFAAVSTIPPYVFSAGASLNLAGKAADIKSKLEPSVTVTELAQKQIRLVDPFTGLGTVIGSLDPVLAAPKINLPVYKELASISTEWLMPGLNTIPDNSMSLLEMNQDCIEAFMLGANYEMARELVWRGYPTDQRGTYFSFFWGYSSSLSSVPSSATPLNNLRDIFDIHDWKITLGASSSLTPLGQNSPRLRSLGPNATMLILTIRGELFRRYPGCRVFLQKAKWTYSPAATPAPYLNRPRVPDTSGLSSAIIAPVFSAEIAPDIYFLGFPVDTTTIKGRTTDDLQPGYFFVFQEQAGEVKFGADEMDQPLSSYTSQIPVDPSSGLSYATWNNLNWGNIQQAAGSSNYDGYIYLNSSADITLQSVANPPDGVRWGRNSASMAYTLLQLPVKLYVHAKELIA
ncbi:hypothetical protein IC235_18415 [Hymenobacter sp. BT664]|uniref:Uncharacterized protein n=1 Tax=Hymenobacter montanus TaxID=2771359 RepID=A0A927GKR4_9BACT|nr:hypothetical protein [Hymenobacter montanus]MBD2769868.1 hypothetical protein [Hymenobacter montanus]